MFYNKKLIVVVLIIISFKSFSQDNYIPGYIINLDNDTITGLINYNGKMKNSAYCEFMDTITNNKAHYNPGDITGYGFDSFEKYLSKKVILDSTGNKITSFLECVVLGKVNFYCYTDDTFKERYFLESKRNGIEELKTKEYRKDFTHVYKFKEYQGFLRIFLGDNNKILAKIPSVRLKRKDIANIVYEYNQAYSNQVYFDDQKNKIKTNLLGIKIIPKFSVGYNFSNHDFFNNDSRFSISEKYKNFSYANLEIGALWKFPFILKNKTSISTSLLYTDFNYKLEYLMFEKSYSYNYNIKNIYFPITLKYELLNKKMTPYIELGLIYGLNLNGSTTKKGIIFSHVNESSFKKAHYYEIRKQEPVNPFGYKLGIGYQHRISNNFVYLIGLDLDRSQLMKFDTYERILYENNDRPTIKNMSYYLLKNSVSISTGLEFNF